MLKNNNWEELAKLWTIGAKINWNVLYEEDSPQKISLPVYPFSKERYWVSCNQKTETISSIDDKCSRISPVLHKNISDIYGLKFSSDFTGKEHFLEAHQVFGEKIMPAAACVELVLVGVRTIVPSITNQENVIFKNVVWINPATASEDGLNIEVKFDVVQEKELNFQIYNSQDKKLIYCRGSVEISSKKENKKYEIQTFLNSISMKSVESSVIYDYFKSNGITYGKYMQGIELLYKGENRVISKLNANESNNDDYYINPVMLDSTLQSAIGFTEISETKSNVGEQSELAPLPFAFDSMEIYEPCQEHMWSCLELEENNSNSQFRKMNIVLINQDGYACEKISNMIFKNKNSESSIPTPNSDDCKIYIPKWKKEEIL